MEEDIVMPAKFRFGWVPFLAAIMTAGAGISLGNWQAGRAAGKEAIEAKMRARESAAAIALQPVPQATEDMEYRRVAVDGEFLDGWTVYLDNRPYGGEPGFYVVTPMRLAGSDLHVLVLRGWAPRNMADRTRLPATPAPKGRTGIQGIVRRGAGQVLQLGQPEPLRPRAIVQNLDVGALAQAAGLRLQPFVVVQTSDTGDGLVRDWPRPSAGVDKHRGYAFQWYALAATALLFFVVTGFRRGTHAN